MSSEITAENAHLYQANCAVVDTQTGEVKEVYTDRKGHLVYRNPLPWWKRMWGAKKTVPLWNDWEYQTTVKGKQTMWEGGLFCETRYHEWDTNAHIYRQTHIYTGARRYYVKSDLATYEMDATAWERERRVVTI